MSEESFEGKMIIVVVLMVVLMIFTVYIGLKIVESFKPVESNILSRNVSEVPKDELVSGSFGSLGIVEADSPEDAIYKLFRNFDPLFLNETKNNRIYYNSFILSLKGKSYDIHNSDLITNLRDGLTEFSSDFNYNIGPDPAVAPDCGATVDSTAINNDDCWSTTIDSAPNPCKIYVYGNGNSDTFSNKIRIRVVWYETGSTVDSKEIINTIITLCGMS